LFLVCHFGGAYGFYSPFSEHGYFRARVSFLLSQGCSKTLMARALATESSMNFLAVKGPELLSKWLGESERTLASIFRRARMASPCIIFFDEIDAIACKRSSGSSTSSNRLLSQLLTELDGIHNMSTSTLLRNTDHKHQTKRVLVVGATNRPDLLDYALTRPGRIDKMIYVGVPDYDSRYQIFQITLQNKSCDHDNINMDQLAEMSDGYSGAEIVAICRDASLLALEEKMIDHDMEHVTQTNLPIITMQHLIKAMEYMPQQITQSMLDFYQAFHQHSGR
jgi:SpoVK/Ycf46/Vps4 family AAA+-type ATPase